MAEVIWPRYNPERDPVLDISGIHEAYENLIQKNPCITRECYNEAVTLLERMKKYLGVFKEEIKHIEEDLRDFDDAHSLFL